MSIFESTGILSNSSDITSIVESATDMYRSIETLEEGVMNYTPSMIPVHARNTTEGTKYIVEFDMLQKLSNYSDMSITEAFEAVCLENGIVDDDAFVVMEDPDKDLGEKCCAGTVTDVDSAIEIDNKIQNKYDDVNELKEAGVNILINSIAFNEAVNPELKKKYREYKKGGNNDLGSQFKQMKELYKNCETISDYKFTKRKLSAFKNMGDLLDKSVQRQVVDLINKCDKQIKDLEEENYQKNADAKQYRRDQLAARKDAKRQARAAKRAAKSE